MTEVLHWLDAPLDELREFCLSKAVGRQVATEVETVPISFMAWVMDNIGTDFDHWEWWVNVLDPCTVRPSGYGILGGVKFDPEAEWCTKFPHAHPWDGKTVNLYIDPAESGGELVIFEDDRETVAEVIMPLSGTVAITEDHVWHGVRAVHGDRPRISIMAGAHRWPRSEQCRCAA